MKQQKKDAKKEGSQHIADVGKGEIMHQTAK
jgi:hypothetical protein